MVEGNRTDLRQEFMMDAVDLIHLQICLEYELDSHGHLVPFRGWSEQAFYIVYRHTCGYLPYFNYLIPAGLSDQPLALGPDEAFEHPEKVSKLISGIFRTCKRGMEIYWSGYFLKSPRPDEFPDAIEDGSAWVVRVDDHVASKAINTRENNQCAEAYIETEQRYRHNGYGRQVTAAWVNQVIDSGQVAFYNYQNVNRPSATLAHSLGVRWYADVVGYEPA